MPANARQATDDRSSLGRKNIGTLIWDFSVPAITGMLVNALYNIVDSIFVGHGVGAVGLAAVTIAFPIMIAFMGFGMLVGVGATTLVSIRIGQQNIAEAEKILGNAFVLGLTVAVSMSAVLLSFLDPVLALLGAEETVLPYARDFTSVILAGSVFMFTGFGLNNIIRAEGHPRIAMMTMILSAFLNTLLNPLFIFVLGLGIKGSALATVISQAVSAAWVIAHFRSRRSLLRLRGANMAPDRRLIAKIVVMGSSAFFMQIAASFVAGLFNNILIIHGGQTAVAAMGIINRVSLLVLMPIFGISQGTQPVIGYNYGAKNFRRVREAVIKGSIAATAVAVTGFVIVELFDAYIIRMFSSEADLIALGATGLKIFMAMLPVIGFQVMGAGFFQAIGKPMHSLLLSMSRQLLILIPALLILPRFIGLQGVWLAGPIADFGAALVTAALVVAQVRRLAAAEEEFSPRG
ncbi:MATE family efflux transporter [Anaeroselena agilis]|uniref:Multidrug export protein MepA n=1 Tax=Anaeroselena agilis TaxID=3063788 RepID=A0ABU3NZ91_9FIRM|nr:MATE family efflux transporter [Selenomonadales bacterium 4137-cl]